MSQAVEYYTDGREAWQKGVLGFFLRLRGLAGAVFLTVISMGAPWWWPSINSEQIHYDSLVFHTVSAGIAGFGVVGAFYYLRHRSRRSLGIKYALHRIAHFIRDKNTELQEKLLAGTGLTSGKVQKEVELTLKELCEMTREYFQLLTGDKSVAVAIRLAVKDQSTEKLQYKTYARSNGLNPNRKSTSEPVPFDEGIPRFLRSDKNALGVLIYNDLDQAAAQGCYKRTKNDDKYRDEIRTMMVAPLNAWAGRKQDMIGILYITSRDGGAFGLKYVDSAGFVADMVAQAVSNTFNIARLALKSGSGTHGKAA
jgi:hypothetical protein